MERHTSLEINISLDFQEGSSFYGTQNQEIWVTGRYLKTAVCIFQITFLWNLKFMGPCIIIIF